MSLLKKIIVEGNKVDEVGELVTLFRSSQLPTIVVERDDDVRIYNRWIRKRLFGTYNLDVLAANGKGNLLHLYERRNEFAGLPVAFVANRGLWLFSGIPKGYEDIICTQGYSIENDVYVHLKVRIENFLDPYLNGTNIGRDRHNSVQKSIIRWLAFKLEVFIQQTPSESNLSLEDLVPNDNFELEEFVSGLSLEDLVPTGHTEVDKSLCKARGFDWPGTQIAQKINRKIREEYGSYLPGKLLFEMLDRFSQTSLDALYNIALTDYESKQRSFIQKIKKKLDEQGFTFSKEISPAPKRQNLVPSTSPGEYLKFGIEMSDAAIRAHPSTPKKESTLSVNELINILKNSSLRTIVVAGQDNAHIINYSLKKYYRVETVNVEFTRKRETLLSAYERRGEFDHKPVAFVADQEMRLFNRTPERQTDIIWTQGYNLKNDLYADANLEVLLEPHEVWRHQQVLKSTIDWFAFEVEEFLRGNPIKMDFQLSEIVPEGEFKLDKGFCQRRGFRQPSPELVQQIRDRYQFLLPADFLFQVLARFLNLRGRDFNFKIDINTERRSLINTGGRSLYDIALAMHDSQHQSLLYTLMQKIEDQLENEQTRIAKTKSSVSQRNQTSNPQNTQPIQLIGKPRVKVGDKVNAKILKKGSIEVTVQLQTSYKEEITFDHPYYPAKVGDKVKLTVRKTNNTGRVTKVFS